MELEHAKRMSYHCAIAIVYKFAMIGKRLFLLNEIYSSIPYPMPKDIPKDENACFSNTPRSILILKAPKDFYYHIEGLYSVKSLPEYS